MTRADKIKLLSEFKVLKHNYNLVLQAYLEHRSKMLSIQAQIITDMPTARTCNKDKVMKMYVRSDSLQEKLSEVLSDMAEAKKRIGARICANSGKVKDIMMYRYILCLSWTQICEKMSLSWVHVHRLHDKGLEGVANEID